MHLYSAELRTPQEYKMLLQITLGICLPTDDKRTFESCWISFAPYLCFCQFFQVLLCADILLNLRNYFVDVRWKLLSIEILLYWKYLNTMEYFLYVSYLYAIIVYTFLVFVQRHSMDFSVKIFRLYIANKFSISFIRFFPWRIPSSKFIPE